MAGAREITSKIKSIENTKKVTSALEMVSASKIRRSQAMMSKSRPYARMMKLDEPDTISHLQAYLFKIASNIAIDRLRSQSRRPQHVTLDAVTEGVMAPFPDVGRVVEARQQLQLISEIVAELPPKCRKAFLLYKFKGQSYREIATHMQLTESMIRKYVLRAIVYCRTRLDDE